MSNLLKGGAMLEELTDKLLKSIKARLGIQEEDTNQDDLIQEEIEDLVIEVLEYCHLKELPRALEPFVKRKVIAYIKSGTTGIVGAWDEEVKSISRGDTTISMFSTKERLTTNDIEVLEKFKDKKVRVM